MIEKEKLYNKIMESASQMVIKMLNENTNGQGFYDSYVTFLKQCNTKDVYILIDASGSISTKALKDICNVLPKIFKYVNGQHLVDNVYFSFYSGIVGPVYKMDLSLSYEEISSDLIGKCDISGGTELTTAYNEAKKRFVDVSYLVITDVLNINEMPPQKDLNNIFFWAWNRNFYKSSENCVSKLSLPYFYFPWRGKNRILESVSKRINEMVNENNIESTGLGAAITKIMQICNKLKIEKASEKLFCINFQNENMESSLSKPIEWSLRYLFGKNAVLKIDGSNLYEIDANLSVANPNGQIYKETITKLKNTRVVYIDDASMISENATEYISSIMDGSLTGNKHIVIVAGYRSKIINNFKDKIVILQVNE